MSLEQRRSSTVSVGAEAVTVLDEQVWQARQHAYALRISSLLAGVDDRRRRGVRHPVEDFLFEYYSFRPRELRRWHPGHGVVLAGESAEDRLSWRDYVRVSAGVTVDSAAVVAVRRSTLLWVRDLLRATAGRAGFFGCFGLHEWAMAYRVPAEQLRHPGWPLRLSPDEVAAVVEERGVRCGHFDAFRFFSVPARPLNLLQPTRADQPALEQPGCLHATMDLYKWAYKLSPLVPSELVADTFALARDVRELDMRASPYDLASLGYPAVAVETPEGRATYVAAQRGFAERAAPLRQALIGVLDAALSVAER